MSPIRQHVTPVLRSWASVLLLIALVAFSFQGTRGLWEPDEGRYVSAALQMLASGDWLVPRVDNAVYLDKPPAIYWSIGAGLKIFGLHEWGARIGHALALLATALLVGHWISRAGCPQLARTAAAAYATSLLAVVAANIITPDTLLAVATTGSFTAYWHYQTASNRRSRWLWGVALGLSLAAGLIVKGTAALVFAAPIVIHLGWAVGPLRALRRLELWAVLLLALSLGSTWYLEVARLLPGSLDYFFDNQVAGRLWKSTYQRNSEWWQPLRVYLPVVALGALPWAFLWVRLARRRGWASLRSLVLEDPLSRFMLLSALAPLLVLSLAKSRLELYALPVLAPLIGLTVLVTHRSGIDVRWRRWVLLAAFGVIAVKGAAGHWPSDRDSRELASSIRSLGVERDACVESLNQRIHGLALYGFRSGGRHMTYPETYPLFEAPPLLEDGVDALAERCRGDIAFVSTPAHFAAARSTLASASLRCDEAERLNRRIFLMECRSR